jgi:hypothetical protein
VFTGVSPCHSWVRRREPPPGQDNRQGVDSLLTFAPRTVDSRSPGFARHVQDVPRAELMVSGGAPSPGGCRLRRSMSTAMAVSTGCGWALACPQYRQRRMPWPWPNSQMVPSVPDRTTSSRRGRSRTMARTCVESVRWVARSRTRQASFKRARARSRGCRPAPSAPSTPGPRHPDGDRPEYRTPQESRGHHVPVRLAHHHDRRYPNTKIPDRVKVRLRA